MTVLVTRPEPQASEWVAALKVLGTPAAALPLIDIAAPHDAQAVSHAWLRLPETRLVMFVSPNAVAWFARQRPPTARWPEHTLACAPGPGTAQAILTLMSGAGLSERQLISPPTSSAQFDSEHLWPLLAPLDWQGQRVMISSGGDQSDARGRAWLAQQLIGSGAQVETVLTYQRREANWQAPQWDLCRMAYAKPLDWLWLFSSSEAIDHLLALAGPPAPQALALATHPRVADKAIQAGFTRVTIVSPRLEAVAQARRSLSVPAA
jgi:uroporphyrinogen-III synthase